MVSQPQGSVKMGMHWCWHPAAVKRTIASHVDLWRHVVRPPYWEQHWWYYNTCFGDQKETMRRGGWARFDWAKKIEERNEPSWLGSYEKARIHEPMSISGAISSIRFTPPDGLWSPLVAQSNGTCSEWLRALATDRTVMRKERMLKIARLVPVRSATTGFWKIIESSHSYWSCSQKRSVCHSKTGTGKDWCRENW